MTRAHSNRPHPTLILGVLSLAGLAYAMLSSAVIPALPTIQHALGATETQIAWLLTAYLLAASVGTAIIGRLGDMYGKERTLLWTLVVLAAGTLLAALSTSLLPLIIGRFIQGASGGIFPLSFGSVRDEFPPKKVAGSIGLLSAILGVGAGIGIVLSGVIVEHLNYHWLFWIPLAATIVAAAATWRFVPESPVRTPGRINWLAATLMTVGMSTVLLAISETTTWGWGSARTLAMIAVGLAISALWVLVEVRSDNPLIDMISADMSFYRTIHLSGNFVLLTNPESWWSHAPHRGPCFMTKPKCPPTSCLTRWCAVTARKSPMPRHGRRSGGRKS